MRSVILGALLIVLVNGGQAIPEKKPVEVSTGNTLFKAPPPTLREMALSADAVVFGRVLGGVSSDGGFYRKSDPGILTSYRFRVSEVLQSFGGHFVSSEELTVIRDGGAIDRGKKIEKLEILEFPQFEPGREYVLFLLWHETHKAWTPQWGPYGTFEVRAGRIRAIGDAKVTKEQDGLNLDEFLTKIRRLS